MCNVILPFCHTCTRVSCDDRFVIHVYHAVSICCSHSRHRGRPSSVFSGSYFYGFDSNLSLTTLSDSQFWVWIRESKCVKRFLIKWFKHTLRPGSWYYHWDEFEVELSWIGPPTSLNHNLSKNLIPIQIYTPPLKISKDPISHKLTVKP